MKILYVNLEGFTVNNGMGVGIWRHFSLQNGGLAINEHFGAKLIRE